MPDQLSVTPQRPHAVERNSVGLPVLIENLKGEMLSRCEAKLPKRNPYDSIPHTVVVTHLEFGGGKFPIPSDSAEQLLNRLHFRCVASCEPGRRPRFHASSLGAPRLYRSSRPRALARSPRVAGRPHVRWVNQRTGALHGAACGDTFQPLRFRNQDTRASMRKRTRFTPGSTLPSQRQRDRLRGLKLAGFSRIQSTKRAISGWSSRRSRVW